MAADREAEPRPRTEEDHERITRAVKLWNEGRDPRGTVAEHYLRSRALDLPDNLAGTVLRFHPRCPWRNESTGMTERIPAMLAAFRSIHDDVITAVHRIRLDRPQLWPKTERRMLGITSQSAIKLGAINARKLLIAEGVESAMAALQLPDLVAASVGGLVKNALTATLVFAGEWTERDLCSINCGVS